VHNRILDISESGARLSLRHQQLVIERAEHGTVTVPFADLAVVLLAHPQVSLTQPVLSALAAHGGALIACDERRLPAGMFLPLQSHSVQNERMSAQAAISLPKRKRLWQQIVRAKIQTQAEVLSELRGTDAGLPALLPLVRSGDPANVEARAARRYWGVLFPGIDFRRDPDACDQNQLLNYGYAVLRAIVARAICAAGLHPSLGLHHHNKYNPFCLADDLMEPFRPVVDRVVASYVDREGKVSDLDPSARREILEALTQRCILNQEVRSLFDAASAMATSLAAVFLGERDELELPEHVWYAAQ
jgi:CRISPR-associated protein Cas1